MPYTIPTIEKITRITEFDLLRTKVKKNNMYICIDSKKMYYDISDDQITGRTLYQYTGVKTINDILYTITPTTTTVYYCWEDNSLWLWNNKWITLYTDTTYPSAYRYDDIDILTGKGILSPVYRNDQPYMLADDNGLLKDGSVVVRDRQRIIKSKLYINDNNDNLVISSFLGGGIRLLPNGHLDTKGELFISDENDSFLRSKFKILNNELYVDYTEQPDQDTNEFKNAKHSYKVYHEGNLNASLLHAVTGTEVVEAIKKSIEKKELEYPIEIDVLKLSGKTIQDLALKKHTHKSTDIEDFTVEVGKKTREELKVQLGNLETEGLLITPTTNSFKFSVNDFKIKLVGAATGTGTVNKLTDTTIEVVVDPTKHEHTDLTNAINTLTTRFNNLNLMNPGDYYTKLQVDEKVSALKGTTVPTNGKPLLVNSEGILPGISEKATKLNRQIKIKAVGQLAGETTTDFSTNEIQINLRLAGALNNVVRIFGQDKNIKDLQTWLKTRYQQNIVVDGDFGDNSQNAFKTAMDIEFTRIDTLRQDVDTLSTSLTSGLNGTLKKTDVGTLVLGLKDGKIEDKNIPTDLLNSIKYKSTYAPNSNKPNNTPKDGDLYIVSQDGQSAITTPATNLKQGDVLIYAGNKWNVLNTHNGVDSINNQKGNVVIDTNTLNAISNTYLDYTKGQTIPANKIPVTSDNGRLIGTTVDKLTNEFSFKVDNTGDIQLAASSVSTRTDGSKDINVKLNLSTATRNNLRDTIAYQLKSDSTVLSFKKYLSIDSTDLKINTEADTYKLGLSNHNFNFIYFGIEELNTTTILEAKKNEFIKLYNQRTTKPLIVMIQSTQNTQEIQQYIIDKSQPNITSASQITLNGYVLNFKEEVDNQGVLHKIRTNEITIKFTYANNTAVLNQIQTRENTTTTKKYLSTEVKTNIGQGPLTADNIYVPTHDTQPVNKYYVDKQISGKVYKTLIGNGTDKSYTIHHNLNSQEILVQFRSMKTEQQVLIDNKCLDNSRLQVNADIPLEQNEIKVLIYKI